MTASSRMTLMPRFVVDFNRSQQDSKGQKIPIGLEGSHRIERYRPLGWLRPGSTVRLHDGEIEVGALLEYDESNSWWFGRPNWPTRRDLKSPGDGLEEFASLPAGDRLVLLGIETGPLLEAILGATELLQALEGRREVGSEDRGRRIVEDLSRMARALSEIAHILSGTPEG
jgi:hypothetical protein